MSSTLRSNVATLVDFQKELTQALTSRDTLIVYHKDCPDGTGSAAVLFNKLVELGFEVSADDARAGYVAMQRAAQGSTAALQVSFVAREYSEGRALPDFAGRNVLVVDFSLKAEPLTQDFHTVCQSAHSVFWLDHHEGAWQQFQLDCEHYQHVPPNFRYWFDATKAGVLLVWQSCYTEAYTPMLVSYLQDRDLNEWKLPMATEMLLGFDQKYATNHVLGYAQAMALSAHAAAGSDPKAKLAEVQQYEAYALTGAAILETRNSLLVSACARAMPIHILGKKGYIVGMQRVLAHDAAMMLASREDAMFGATFEIESTSRVKVSFRGDKYCEHKDQTVLAYAKHLNGGGHPYAAACYLSWEQFTQLLAGGYA